MDTVATSSGQPVPEIDDATLLRQAALLSLKAKRRTGLMRQSPTPRTDPDAVTLVYDEPPAQPLHIVRPHASVESRVVPEAKPPSIAELEDGEISDPEGAPINGSLGKVEVAPPPDPPPKPPQDSNHQISVPTVAGSQPLRVVTLPLDVRMEVDSPSTSSSSVASHSSSRPPPSVVARIPSPAALANLRSKLQMTPQDIFEAKVVILDILGWGVPASFLLDCGVSPLAVVVCLSELKLRIPEGLIPVVEEAENEVRDASVNGPDRGETIVISPIGSNMAVSSPDLSPGDLPSSLPSRPSFLPPKPLTISTRPKNPVSSADVPAPISTVSVQLASVDLNDIEQQRKQELMARRAVLQSLKGKSNAGSSVSASNPPVPPSPPVQTLPRTESSVSQEPSTAHDMQIDMFIADAITRSEDVPNSSQSIAEESPNDAMEVEQALQSTEKEEYTPVSGLVPSNNSGIQDSSLDTAHYLGNGHLSLGNGGTPGFNAFIQHRSLENGNSSFATPSAVGLPASVSSPPGIPPPRLNSTGSASLKRIGKRPVAADFVDYTPSDQSRSRFDSSYTETGPHHHKRRKHFGPVVSHRLVIDVSDGETGSDEDDDDIPEPRLLNVVNGSVTQTPPEPQREGSAPVDDPKLKLWEEKQKEILRMRELIRSMEEKKKRAVLAESVSSGEGETTRSTSDPTKDGPNSILRPPSAGSIHPSYHQVSAASVSSTQSITMKTEDVTPDFISGTEAQGRMDSDPTAADSTNAVGKSNPHSSNTVDHIPFDSDASSLSTLIVDDQRQDRTVMINADINSPDLGWNGTDAQGTSTSSVEIASNSRNVSDDAVSIESHSVFRPYISPFALYPSLRPQSSPSLHSLSTIVPVSASSFASSHIAQIQQLDFGRLRRSQAFYFADPQRRLCQYEIPGGGTCRDDGCQDFHHRDLVPDDGELARFVAPSLPDFTPEQILNALSSVRLPSTLDQTGQYPLQADPLSQRVADAVQLLMGNGSGEIAAS